LIKFWKVKVTVRVGLAHLLVVDSPVRSGLIEK